MKNYKKGFIVTMIVILVIVIILAIIGVLYSLRSNSNTTSSNVLENKLVQKNNVLPDSFTLEMYTDSSSSSGAVRIFNGELTFKNSNLASGQESYYTVQGGGCAIEDCKKNTIECVIKNGQWVDKNGEECKVENFIALTKEGIEKQINAKEIVLSEDFSNFSNCHYKTCYRIKKGNSSSQENHGIGNNQIGWKTYSNSQYGFSLSYPADYIFSESNNGGFFNELNIFELFIHVPNGYQKGTDFSIGAVNVMVSPSISKCYSSDGVNEDMTSTKIINGKSFKYNPRQPLDDSAMGGQVGSWSMFTTVEKGQCYRIEKQVGYRNSRGFKDPPYPPHFDEQKANSDLDNIISTFLIK